MIKCSEESGGGITEEGQGGAEDTKLKEALPPIEEKGVGRQGHTHTQVCSRFLLAKRWSKSIRL